MFVEMYLCIALNVYWEARDQSDIGQRAIAHVVYNRAEDPRFPNSVCDVVYQKNQFSWFWDGELDTPTDMKAWAKAQAIALEVVPGHLDPTRGALYYHSDKVNPWWSKEFELTVKLGDHYFYKD